jgi:hypothetical protein
VRQIYGAVRAALKRIGPVRMDSTKTRIAFRVWTNFLELSPMKDAWRGCLMLPRRRSHKLFFRVVSLSPRIHYHYFTLTDPKQLDAAFRRLLAEAYTLGRREHLKKPLKTLKPQIHTDTHRYFIAEAQRPQRKRKAQSVAGELRVTSHELPPLWRCPKCGNYFVSRNLAHSCVSVPLDAHFRGKDPLVRKTFDALVRALRSVASAQNKRAAPIRIVSSKTRITFMLRMRFAGVTPQKNALPGHLLLLRPGLRHPLLRPGMSFGRTHSYGFRLTHPRQIDAGFRRLLAEACRVGRQEHLQS